MSIVLGMDCVLYRGTAGSTASTEMTNVQDVTLNLETDEADVTTRGNSGWRASVATLKNGTVEFTMIWDTADTDFTAIQSAYFNKTAIALFVADSNGEGLDADFTIINFTINQPLAEATTVSVTAKPTYSTRAPSWAEGS